MLHKDASLHMVYCKTNKRAVTERGALLVNNSKLTHVYVYRVRPQRMKGHIPHVHVYWSIQHFATWQIACLGHNLEIGGRLIFRNLPIWS